MSAPAIQTAPRPTTLTHESIDERLDDVFDTLVELFHLSANAANDTKSGRWARLYMHVEQAAHHVCLARIATEKLSRVAA